MKCARPLALLLCCLVTIPGYSGELKVAVAANFIPTMKLLVARYRTQADSAILVSSGSTGKLYAQIVNGAPYDLFFAADSERPAKLESDGMGVRGSRFSYALGRLVLWSPQKNIVREQPPHFAAARVRFFAIGNPKLAPYGAAAKEVLMGLGEWERLQGRLVQGENINQTFNFVRSGNADMGMVALSQLSRTGQLKNGSAWIIPQQLHSPIEQQAIIINNQSHVNQFVAFVKSPTAREIIRRHGYDLPE